MAKINPLFVLISVLVVIFFVLILTSGPGYLPYDDNKHSYAAYEPFATEEEEEEEKEQPESSLQSEIGLPPSMPETMAMNGNTASSSSSASAFGLSSIVNMISPGTENFEPLIEVPQTVQYGPFRDSEIIDKFSQVTTNGMDGVDGCVSSGLSNAGGYICLTPELIQLLKSRGGNATGK